jgi:hypothetical protein
MHESISPETIQKLDEAARDLSRKHHIDATACKEVRSHMESKLLGYLSDAEKLTEEDAFVLVREHFGEPDHLKHLLRKVHAPEKSIVYAGRFAGLPMARG